MGKPTGFIEFERQTNPMRPEEEGLRIGKKCIFYGMKKPVKLKAQDVWTVGFLFVIEER